MSDNEKNVPKIRFPGFTGAWEQCRLGMLQIHTPEALHRLVIMSTMMETFRSFVLLK